jgi:hypothetical protein
MPDWPALPSLTDPGVAAAVEKWALFSALVPDATWDQLQAVRENFPEIRTVLSENRHLQCLIDWVELKNEAQRAESVDGATLQLDADHVEDLILRFRKTEAGLPENQRFEARSRRLLLAQLGATEPDDPLMRGFWQLKRMRHQLAIDADKAAALLNTLIAGAWHNEAIEAVTTELNRDKASRCFTRATRDGLEFASGANKSRLRVGDLVRPPFAILAATGTMVLIIVSVAVMSLNYVPLVREAFLAASFNFEGVLPSDYSISAPESKSPSLPRAFLYDEDPADPKGKQYVGSVAWRTGSVRSTGRADDIEVVADIDVPERRVKMSLSFRRNLDRSLPASHTIEMRFQLPPDFLGGGISNIPGIQMKLDEKARGTPLVGLSVKVTDNFFLVGLSNVLADRTRNLELIQRPWFDIPLVYSNQKRAIVAFEKAVSGDEAFRTAFAAWGEDHATSTKPSDPTSAAGLWQKIEDGKSTGWFLIVDHNGTFEGIIAKMFPKPGDPPNPTCSKCTDDRKDMPWLGIPVIRDMKRNGFSYENGNVLDPRDGSIYKAKMTLSPDGQKLTLRGFVGVSLFGKDEIWERLPDNATSQLDPSIVAKYLSTPSQQAKVDEKFVPAAPSGAKNKQRKAKSPSVKRP